MWPSSLQPASGVVLGSSSRGEADSQSDLDVVVVRPSNMDIEHDAWRSAVERRRDRARRLTRNHVEIVEVTVLEAGRHLGHAR